MRRRMSPLGSSRGATGRVAGLRRTGGLSPLVRSLPGVDTPSGPPYDLKEQEGLESYS